MALSPQQTDVLLRAINPARVSKDRNNRSHVEAYEIRAHLNRIFGFAGWSQTTDRMELIFETVEDGLDKKGEPTGKRVVTCAYRAQVVLRVHATDATYTEWAVGGAANFPAASRADAHDFAAKTAESQALKRCAVNLGDQFGLGLYNGGSTQALVRKLVHQNAASDGGDAPDAHITAPLPAEEPAPVEQPATPDPEPEAPTETPPPAAPFDLAEFRDRILKTRKHTELGSLLAEAIRGKVAAVEIADENGEPCTVKALIQRRLTTRGPRKETPARAAS